MSYGVMDLAPILYVIRVMERPLFFLIRGLITMITVVSVISPVSCVDFLIILLLLRGPLATRFKKSRLGLGSLYAYISNYEWISHRLGLLHDDLPHSLDIVEPVAQVIDNLNVLDVQDSVPGIAETFHVVPEALIMLLLDGL
jgi:hypothetical protein